MSTHKNFDKICCVVLVFVLIITVLFMNGEKLGIKTVANALGYEDKLFDKTVVHTLDIVIEDWDSFLETCTNEEYTACSVVIDNEAFKNIALRAKGNTSLTNVKNYGNSRYSLKIEFDKYDSTKTYYGLDKLCLNNIIQDNTYMKDYLTYTMMGEFGVASPLCSYVYVTVNGEDWGLFLAVEGVEDSFLQRNYGNENGDLYKPDSQQMGGGRGNGKGFDMDDFKDKFENSDKEQTTQENRKNDTAETETAVKAIEFQPMSENGQQGDMPPQMPDGERPQMPNGEMPPDMPDGEKPPDIPNGEMPERPQTSDGQEQEKNPEEKSESENQDNAENKIPDKGFQKPEGEMGSDDVKLIYSDDEFSSYSNIFDNAKTKVTDSDKKRLIASLKNINENTDIENSVDVESVIRYFVIHNFVLNFDSYTGSMIHNYYLYENEGKLSMIPWDYNLAFGGFQSMGGAESLVNYPIDSPVSGGDNDSRPMLSWIFNNEEYTQQYHKLFGEFISEYFDSGKFETEINRVKNMISAYVKKDSTKFCTYDEFDKGVETLEKFCLLRAESINKQLDGTIGSTSDTQTDKTDFVKADGITISDMGSMGNMGGKPDKKTQTEESDQGAKAENTPPEIPQKSNDDKVNSFDKSDRENSQKPKTNMTETIVVSSISLAVLIIGILFAVFYCKRRK